MSSVNDSKPLNKGGRPPHRPTEKDRQMVEVMAGYAIPQDKIALVLGIDHKTLSKHYERELESAAAKLEGILAGHLLTLAKGRDGTALKAVMFSLQMRFGWSQYAPEPLQKLKPMGKKEEANIAAQMAHEGNDWAHLVN